MSLRVDFVETTRRWRGALPARTLARQAIAAALGESGVALRRGAEVSVHLSATRRYRRSTRNGAGKDAPTNVLSFPAADPARVGESKLLGDVLIAFETVVREAEEEGKTLADHFRHLVIHGFLHLLGLRSHRGRRRPRRWRRWRRARSRGSASPIPMPSVNSTDARPMSEVDKAEREPSGRAGPWPVRAAARPAGPRRRIGARRHRGRARGRRHQRRLHAARARDPEERARAARRPRRRRDGAARRHHRAWPSTTPLSEVLALFRTAGHSRLPVFGETLDDPQGMIHIRDFVDFLASEPKFGLAPEGSQSARHEQPSGVEIGMDMPLVGRADPAASPLRAAARCPRSISW